MCDVYMNVVCVCVCVKVCMVWCVYMSVLCVCVCMCVWNLFVSLIVCLTSNEHQV